jgi:hypothetical protein
MAVKVVTLKLSLYTRFEELNTQLVVLLNDIKTQAPLSSTSGPAAYGTDYGKAKALIQSLVDSLSPTDIGYFVGLKFTSPTDDKSNRTDVVNSIISAWDAAAAKYMKGQVSAGDALALMLLARLKQFDVAVQTAGKTSVPPDT